MGGQGAEAACELLTQDTSPTYSRASTAARLKSAVPHDLASLRCTRVLDGAPGPRLRARVHQLVQHNELESHCGESS
jgi:hypothetical protein